MVDSSQARERRLARHLDEHAEFDTIRHREIDGQAILHEDDLHLLEQRGIGRLPIDDRDLARARRQPPGLRRILHDECGHADMQRFLGDLVRGFADVAQVNPGKLLQGQSPSKGITQVE